MDQLGLNEHPEVRLLSAPARRRLVDRLNLGTCGCEHAERVRMYSRVLAEDLERRGVYPDECWPGFSDLVWLASGHHDIGKAAVSPEILNKPGPLDHAERRAMEAHTRIGGAALAGAVERWPDEVCPRLIRDIAMHHHEWWDGSGYPDGLSGRSIPLAARIVALADVYDALTSSRPYKAAWAHSAARELITRHAGRQFDPEVVRSFLACEDEFCAIRSAGHATEPSEIRTAA